MAVKAKEKLNMEPETKETPAPIPEEGKDAETPAEVVKQKFHFPKPSETKAGQWLKKHAVGIGVGIGMAALGLLVGYAKGTNDAFESLPPEDDDDEEVIDADAVEVEDENEE